MLAALQTPIEPAPAAPAPDRLPTLTEVVDLSRAGARVQAVSLPVEAGRGQLVDEVLAELAPRVELLLEARLREALAPALARAADGLIRDSRTALNASLRDLVEESVARTLARRGGG